MPGGAHESSAEMVITSPPRHTLFAPRPGSDSSLRKPRFSRPKVFEALRGAFLQAESGVRGVSAGANVSPAERADVGGGANGVEQDGGRSPLLSAADRTQSAPARPAFLDTVSALDDTGSAGGLAPLDTTTAPSTTPTTPVQLPLEQDDVSTIFTDPLIFPEPILIRFPSASEEVWGTRCGLVTLGVLDAPEPEWSSVTLRNAFR